MISDSIGTIYARVRGTLGYSVMIFHFVLIKVIVLLILGENSVNVVYGPLSVAAAIRGVDIRVNTLSSQPISSQALISETQSSQPPVPEVLNQLQATAQPSIKRSKLPVRGSKTQRHSWKIIF